MSKKTIVFSLHLTMKEGQAIVKGYARSRGYETERTASRNTPLGEPLFFLTVTLDEAHIFTAIPQAALFRQHSVFTEQ
ncbi:hypothetical protein EBR25_08010 [bacterium]|jgi:hypothetical protein|nr:hypothetical protein [bacterium]